MAQAKRHIHKYHKIDLTFAKVWACALPNCSHYMPQHLEGMIPGKFSICWQCGEKFVLDANNMKNDMPICDECNPNKKSIDEFLEHSGIKSNDWLK